MEDFSDSRHGAKCLFLDRVYVFSETIIIYYLGIYEKLSASGGQHLSLTGIGIRNPWPVRFSASWGLKLRGRLGIFDIWLGLGETSYRPNL